MIMKGLKGQKKEGRLGSSLRAEAEQKLKKIACASGELKEKTHAEIVHELNVHQIELERHNEALREAQLALEESRDKYVDLYDFAPISYFIFTPRV